MAKTIENYISDINSIVELIKADIAGLGNLIPPAENNETLREIFNPENELITTILRSINSEIINPDEKFTLDRANTLNNRIKLYSAIVTGLIGGVGLAGSHSILSGVSLNKSDINLYKDEIDNFGNYYTMLLSMLPVAKFHAYLDTLGDISNGVIPFIHKLLDLNPYLFFNNEFTTKFVMYKKFWDVVTFKDIKLSCKFYMYFFYKQIIEASRLNLSVGGSIVGKRIDIEDFVSNCGSNVSETIANANYFIQLKPLINNTYFNALLESKIFELNSDISKKENELLDSGGFDPNWESNYAEEIRPKYGDLVDIRFMGAGSYIQSQSRLFSFFGGNESSDWIKKIIVGFDSKYQNSVEYKYPSDSVALYIGTLNIIFNMIFTNAINFGLKYGSVLSNYNTLCAFITPTSFFNNLGIMMPYLTDSVNISTKSNNINNISDTKNLKSFLMRTKIGSIGSGIYGYIFNFSGRYTIPYSLKNLAKELLNSFVYKYFFIRSLINTIKGSSSIDLSDYTLKKLLNNTFSLDIYEDQEMAKYFVSFIKEVINDLYLTTSNTSIKKYIDPRDLYNTLDNFGGITTVTEAMGNYNGKFVIFSGDISSSLFSSTSVITPKTGSDIPLKDYQTMGSFINKYGFVIEGTIKLLNDGDSLKVLRLT